MPASAKTAAMILQNVWNATPTSEKGWRINGSPGLGDWFQMIAPDGSKFIVHVERDERAAAEQHQPGDDDAVLPR